MIHTIGDSQSSNIISGWKDCHNIISHHLGAILCYSFGNEKLNRCDIRKFNIKDGDTVVFAFGEIDCRCHIHKHVTQNKTFENIIIDIIHNYVEAIKANLNVCSAKLKNVCIYNVVPPVKKSNCVENPVYPYLGTDEERKKYVLCFNKHLKIKCDENNWVFFDVYNNYTDEEGFLNKKFSDGNIHIQNEIYLKQFINKNLSATIILWINLY